MSKHKKNLFEFAFWSVAIGISILILLPNLFPDPPRESLTTNFAGALVRFQTHYFDKHGRFASDPNQLDMGEFRKEFKYSNGYYEFSGNPQNDYTLAGEIRIIAYFEDNSTHKSNAERPSSGIIMLLYGNEYSGGYWDYTTIRLIKAFYFESSRYKITQLCRGPRGYSRSWIKKHEDIPIIGGYLESIHFFNMKKKDILKQYELDKQRDQKFFDALYPSQTIKLDKSKESTINNLLACPLGFEEIK